ncbi:MAG: glycosyltransferase [Candidatus Delongbacteria bacterium]|nr:glycosyltransferase [Candidatus Delongbacteria bacterium]
MKKIYITVTNDLQADQRMHKTALTLSEHGYDVYLLGRILPESHHISRPYQTKRLKFMFNRGCLFYAAYNIRLFSFLLFHSWDIVLSCDMDSLPAGFLASRLRRKHVVFDSHELFSEVPEIQHKPLVKSVWRWFEKLLIPRVKHVFTVSEHIAAYYHQHYGTRAVVIRNLPFKTPAAHCKAPVKPSHPFVLYQGALNTGRGIVKLMDAMQYASDLSLVIAGSGPLEKHLHTKKANLNYKDRIYLPGRLSFNELSALTSQAWLGVSLEEDKGLNYRFALPNKLFDYIKAGVPVLVSDLPEMKRFVEMTQTGWWISPDADARTLAKKIINVWNDTEAYRQTSENTKAAIEKYNWEKESLKQLEVFRSI